MLRLFGYEEEVDGSICHGNRHPPARYSGKWKRQNRYMTSLSATGMRPHHAWRKSHASIKFGIVVV